MAYTLDQIEKHTIVTRLSVSIYKMTDEQLQTLLNLLETSPGIKGAPMATQAPDLPPETKEVVQRQIIVANIFILIKQMDKDTLLERLRLFKNSEFQWVREYPRLTCYLLVDFAAKGRVYRSCIRDISAGGVFIETNEEIEKDQPIALCFTLPESKESLPFKIKGKVKRIYPDGIGVQYENISKYQREIIDLLIKRI